MTASYPVPSLSDGTLVVDSMWNAHVDAINDLNTRDNAKVPTSRTITPGTGLTGGGDLSANRTLAVSYGTAAGTAAQGNDSRITITQDATVGNNALGTRVTAVESGRALNKTGRWYSTSTNTHNTGTQAITSWIADGTVMSDITVSGTTWTVVNAGTYEITGQYHGTMAETSGTGGNTNFFIAKPDLTAVYAQSQGYRVQYQSGTIEVSDNISSGPVAFAAGATFSVYLGSATPVGITLSNSLKRTFVSAKRIS
ncbi:hypothetical protein FPZ12_029610 [Amycolatopsis acidicola]|uniref:Uncharacterized protein n=1 Tax=Amycolatopsis acidicola TaxID=2596893 RepID=A0A5N0UV40_9PSEU|nr:hypothetical protein [Amycolatopsis acidicola]KAA9155555.1 hypothetical protein FPZ12_029610 [Amycolatopsis acidicola]